MNEVTRGRNFFVGTFGEDGGKSELAVFDKHFSAYTLPFKSQGQGTALPR